MSPSDAPEPLLREVVAVLERLYPGWTAQPWDAVGLVCGDPDEPVRRVLLAVDPVEAVVDEVVAGGYDLLLTHHPLHLRGTTSVAATTAKGRVVHRLVDDGRDGVDCEQHPSHRRLGVTAHQPDGVPVLRPRRRVEVLEDRDDVGQAQAHGAEARRLCARQ